MGTGPTSHYHLVALNCKPMVQMHARLASCASPQHAHPLCMPSGYLIYIQVAHYIYLCILSCYMYVQCPVIDYLVLHVCYTCGMCPKGRHEYRMVLMCMYTCSIGSICNVHTRCICYVPKRQAGIYTYMRVCMSVICGANCTCVMQVLCVHGKPVSAGLHPSAQPSNVHAANSKSKAPVVTSSGRRITGEQVAGGSAADRAALAHNARQTVQHSSVLLPRQSGSSKAASASHSAKDQISCIMPSY